MNNFILKIFLYLLATLFISEFLIRIMKLTNEVPHRKINPIGLQTYISNQQGYFNNNNWKVNDFGFLGLSDINSENQLMIIGDSFIENIMNPIECNQGSNIKRILGDKYGVFEVGRSGITMIESLEFMKQLSPKVNPKLVLIYLSENDVLESISNIKRLKDRLQINVRTKKIEKVILKYPLLKKFLYEFKSLYYFYIKGGFVLKIKHENSSNYEETNNNHLIKSLFSILLENYDFSNVLFIVHSSNKFIDNLLDDYKLENIKIKFSNSNWFMENDSHWNCIGHRKVSELITETIQNKFINYNL